MKNYFILILFSLSFLSCQKPDTAVGRTVALKVVAPPELSDLIAGLKSELEAQNAGTSVKIQLEHINEYSINAADKISSGEIKAELWISPLPALVQYANSKIVNLGAKQVQCKKIFETPVVVAAQESFIENFKERSSVFSWNDFIDLTIAAAEQKAQNYLVSYVIGKQETTSSGLPSLLQLIFFAGSSKEPALKLENIKTEEVQAKFLRFLNKAAYYTHKDEMLFKKAAFSHEHLFFGLSTEQQLIKYNISRAADSKNLFALYPQEGSVWLEYELCASEADWVTQVQKGAISEVMDFVMKRRIQKNFISFGFRSALADTVEEEYAAFPKFGAISSTAGFPRAEIGDGVLKYIFSNPAKFIRPIAAIYVLDTSGSTESTNSLSAGKQMMRALMARNKESDLSAFMTFSEDPKLILPFDNNHASKIKALDVQQGTGGSSMYDAVAESIRQVTKDELQSFRKVIYIFTDGNDNKSRMSLGTLIDLIKETRRHHDISVEIVALEGEGVDLSDIEKISTAFNGNIYKTSLFEIERIIAELSGAY